MAKTPTTTPTKLRVSVLDRRLNDPFGMPSIPIQFKDPGLIGRWFNAAISNDKIWTAKQIQGWASVTPDMIVDLDQIGGFNLSPTTTIVRGDRGQEHLLCMPRVAFDQIQMAKTRKNNERMGNSARTKSDVVAAASEKYGDEAADFLNRHVGPVGDVQDSYERIERKPMEDE